MIKTQNEAWGFWGAMRGHASAAWPVAFDAIQDATGTGDDAVLAFLDSRYGRHFADDVCDRMASGDSMNDAIAGAISAWMNVSIGRISSRATGIPIGTPYLTGLVINEGFAAESDAP